MDNETLTRVADAVTDGWIKLEIDIHPRNILHQGLQQMGWMPKKKIFQLTNVRLGTLIRISRILLGVDVSFFDVENLLQSNYAAVEKYGEKLAECVALCIHNKKGDVPAKLIFFVLDNFTTAELYRMLSIVLKQMDIGSFMSSIISISGVNVLASPAKMSQQMTGGIIALGQ